MRRLVKDLPRSAAGFAWTCAASWILGAAAPLMAADRANLNYDVDASLLYVDALRVPRTGTGATSQPLAAVSEPHALGLRRLALGLNWQASSQARLHLVLRPDAVNRHDEAGGTQLPVREVDTRSGDGGLQPTPTVRLLDEYQLVLSSRPGLSLGVGVWSGLGPVELAYPELLGFGLKVLFPAKFSGLKLSWQPLSLEPDRVAATAAALKPAPLAAELTVFQGNEDRGEGLASKHDTFDVAPSARDPYYGVGLRLSAAVGSRLDLGLLIGFLDQADAQGRYDQVFGQLSATEVFALGGRQSKVNLEARYLRSRGRVLVEPQTLESASLSTAIAVADELWALAGVDYGRGDRWSSDLQRDTSKHLQGYELSAGVLSHFGEELSLQFMVSREYRNLRDKRGKSGGFQDAAGDRTGVNRMGLELTYQLNKNA